MLVIAEPELLPDGSMRDHGEQVFSSPTVDRVSREALCYKVLIHLHNLEDFDAAAAPHHPFAPSSDYSGLGGLPHSDSDKSGLRRHFFPTASGLVDGATSRPGHSESSNPKSCSCSDVWRLPSLSDEVRLSGD